MAKILVVDDRCDNREYFVQLLNHCGHEMLEACDGSEALEQVRRTHPDLVIADILMPTIDGYEFARRLRLDPAIAHTPVVFHSAAYFKREVLPLAQACGVSHVLFKPVEPQQVLDTVGAALGVEQRPAAHPAVLPEFDRDHLRLLTDKLSQKANELELANRRLTALVDLGLELGRQLDQRVLLEKGTLAARTILGAKFAAAGIIDKTGRAFNELITSGIETDTAATLRSTVFSECLRCPLLSQRRPHRRQALRGDSETCPVAKCQPPHTSSLCAPIASLERVYGLLYVGEKAGAGDFTPEDERLAGTIAAQFAIVSENAQRHAELVRQAGALESEVAERKRIEAQIRTLNAELEVRVKERTAELTRSNAELEQFAYVAAHDLQEPLRKVVGYTQLIAQNYKSRLDEDADEYISYTVDGALRMQTLIKDLLAYSRVGKNGLEVTQVNCAAVLHDALDNLTTAITESSAQVTHDPLPNVLGVERQLIQLFQNLIGNAIKFRSEQPPQVHIGAKREGDEWIFSVGDNGIGIDPQYADRIFVIFQRLHSRATYPGTGIGLAICKKIVEQHRGRIWVESQPGGGATFFFTIPAWWPV